MAVFRQSLWAACMVALVVALACNICVDAIRTTSLERVPHGALKASDRNLGPVPAPAKPAAAAAAKASASPVTTHVATGEPTGAEWKVLFTQWKAQFKHSPYKTPATEARAFEAFKKRQRASVQRHARVNAQLALEAKHSGKPASKVIFDASKSPIGAVEEEHFRKTYLGGRPPLTHPAKVAVKSTTAPTPTAASAASKAVRFQQLSQSPPAKVISSPKDVPAPKGGDNLTKKRTGGDNLTKKRTGGDNLGAALSGGDNLTKKRTGGDNLGAALEGGDNLTKKRTGGDNLVKKRTGGDNLDKQAGGGDNLTKKRTGGVSATKLTTQDRREESQSAWQSVAPTQRDDIRMVYDARGRQFPLAVRNQAECSSCWAVVAAEHFQAILLAMDQFPLVMIDGDNLNARLSAQQIIDCYRTENDKGCSGGTVVGAFEFMQRKGVVQAPAYEFLLDGTQHKCGSTFPIDNHAKKIDSKHLPLGIYKVPEVRTFKAPKSLFLAEPCLTGVCKPNPEIEQSLLLYWKTHTYKRFGLFNTIIPMVAYVDASNWADYAGGIYPASECSSQGEDLAHIVQIVGYGVTNDASQTPFWMVRNSWGREWGEDGHIRLPFGVNACGVFNYVIHLDGTLFLTESQTHVTAAAAALKSAPRLSKLADYSALLNGRKPALDPNHPSSP